MDYAFGIDKIPGVWQLPASPMTGFAAKTMKNDFGKKLKKVLAIPIGLRQKHSGNSGKHF